MTQIIRKYYIQPNCLIKTGTKRTYIALRHDTSRHLSRSSRNVAPHGRRKCVCHISRHSSFVAVLQGIRGALIQTRAVKSVRVLPSSTYYLGTSIGSFVHAADELHHAMRGKRPFQSKKEASWHAYGNAVAREKSVYISSMCRSQILYEELPIL